MDGDDSRGEVGDIVLENLSLRENALRRFNLPIDVRYGFLGRLVVKIPWSNLFNAPVLIQIENLYAVAAPQFGSEVRSNGDFRSLLIYSAFFSMIKKRKRRRLTKTR